MVPVKEPREVTTETQFIGCVLLASLGTPTTLTSPATCSSIDCGTTSCRFYIFNQWGDVICSHQIEFEQREKILLESPGASLNAPLRAVYPEPGWHEHDPTSYPRCIDECITQCLATFEELGYSKDMLEGVGIATQRETTLVWDRLTGKPLYNASAFGFTCGERKGGGKPDFFLLGVQSLGLMRGTRRRCES